MTRLSNNGGESTLTLAYRRKYNGDENRKRAAKQALDLIADCLKNISFEFHHSSDLVNTYLGFVFTMCPLLHQVNFTEGYLQPVPQKKRKGNTNLSITSLALRQVKMAEKSLYYLSKSFPYLESMKIEDCEMIKKASSNNDSDIDDDGDEKDAETSEATTRIHCNGAHRVWNV